MAVRTFERFQMRPLLVRAQAFLLCPIAKSDGETLPFSRFDIFLGAVLSIASMVLFGGFFEAQIPASAVRGAIVGLVAVLALIFARAPRLVLGAALAVVSLRLWAALLLHMHSFAVLCLTVVCTVSSVVLLRKYVVRDRI